MAKIQKFKMNNTTLNQFYIIWEIYIHILSYTVCPQRSVGKHPEYVYQAQIIFDSYSHI